MLAEHAQFLPSDFPLREVFLPRKEDRDSRSMAQWSPLHMETQEYKWRFHGTPHIHSECTRFGYYCFLKYRTISHLLECTNQTFQSTFTSIKQSIERIRKFSKITQPSPLLLQMKESSPRSLREPPRTTQLVSGHLSSSITKGREFI